MFVQTPHPNMKFHGAKFFHADRRLYGFSLTFPAIFVRFPPKLISLDNFFSLNTSPPTPKNEISRSRVFLRERLDVQGEMNTGKDRRRKHMTKPILSFFGNCANARVM